MVEDGILPKDAPGVPMVGLLCEEDAEPHGDENVDPGGPDGDGVIGEDHSLKAVELSRDDFEEACEETGVKLTKDVENVVSPLMVDEDASEGPEMDVKETCDDVPLNEGLPGLPVDVLNGLCVTGEIL